jgi:hypothetical protein
MIRRVISPLKEFGFFAGVLYLIDRVFGEFSTKLRLFNYELMVQPIHDKPLIPTNMLKQIELREIKCNDPEVSLIPVPPNILGSRFKQNAICLGAFQKGIFIGYIWFCFGAYEEDEVRCTFDLNPKAKSVFDFDLYLFPEHRHGLGFMGIWERANQFLHGQGINYSFSRLTRYNLASRKAHAHLGWKRIGCAFFLKAWNMEVMVATVFPYLGFTLTESQRIRLKLHSDVLQYQLST